MNYAQEITDAVRAAKGWEVVSGTQVRRTVTHETPEDVPDRWWPQSTYDSFELLTFTLLVGRKPIITLTTSTAPWVGSHKQRVSHREALRMLRAAP